jgi:hypothetical protein
MNKQTKISLISILFSIVSVYILCQFCILYGIQKERNSKICVDPYSLKLYENNINGSMSLAGLAFEKAQKDLNDCKNEIEKWKINYSWLKKQKVSTSTLLTN